MTFDPGAYGPGVASILALEGAGARLMPLVAGRCSNGAAAAAIGEHGAAKLFPRSRAPEAAVAGLWLYFSAFDEAHTVAQAISSAEGSYWHALVHRQEPDAGNSSYWFRRVGRHAVFPALRERAATIGAAAGLGFATEWDPYAFIDVCERARRSPGSALERAALEIQREEWRLLFDWCASAR